MILAGRPLTFIFTSSRRKLHGALTIRVRAKGGRLDLRAVLAELVRRGIRILLVEGGPTVHSSFLAEGLVDEARVFIAPKLISGAKDPNRAPRVQAAMRKLGPDFLFYGKVVPYDVQ